MSFDRGADHPLWRIACRRGWRRSIRRVLAVVQVNRGVEEFQGRKPYESGAGQRFGLAPAVNEQVRQSGGGGRGLEAAPAGRIEAGAATSSADTSGERQHEQPATSGTR